MKNITTIILASVLCLQSCAQNDKEMNAKTTQILGSLYKEVQHYDKRINYHATLLIGGCNYELLINDFPVDRYFGSENGSGSGSVPINRAILKPGVQSWKIRIYPIHDQKEIDDKIQMTPRPEIEDGARIELDIEGIRFKKNGDIEKRLGKIVEFKTPVIEDKETRTNKLADAGKSYIEYSGTFQADVPYHLNGWENSDDLTKDNKENLEQALLREYEKYRSWIQNRELDKIAESNLKSEQEEAQALFYDSKTNNTIIEENYINGWGQKGLKAYPLENYIIKYYGNGKLVTLQRKDYVGDPALAGEFENEKTKTKTKQMKTFYLFFHRSKGKKELEVIR